MDLVERPLETVTFRIVDVEPTGFSAARDRVVEIAAVDLRLGEPELHRPLSHLVNPGRSIPRGAYAVHGISARMVADAPALEEIIGEYRAPDTVYVAHNAAFDSGFLTGLPGPWLCTVRLARQVFPGAPSYRNQELRAWRQIDRLPEWAAGLQAHRALYDVAVTGLLLQDMLAAVRQQADAPACVGDLLSFAARPALLERIGFGKHKGTRYAGLPTSYLRWMAEVDDWGPDVAATVQAQLKLRAAAPEH